MSSKPDDSASGAKSDSSLVSESSDSSQNLLLSSSEEDCSSHPEPIAQKSSKRKRDTSHNEDEEKKPACIRRQQRAYSDSDNSYEVFREPRTVINIDPINFEDHENSVWGRRHLYANLSDDDLDTLVGLATSLNAGDGVDASTGVQIDRLPPNLQKSKCQNPLLTLASSPLPLSYLDSFVLRSSRIPEFDKKLYQSFQDSALVAIGMALEDIITASLLPLAGCHVLRCRELEDAVDRPEYPTYRTDAISRRDLQNPVTGQQVSRVNAKVKVGENAFEAWTLPPEEAILKVAQQGFVPVDGLALTVSPRRCTPSSSDEGNATALETFYKYQQLDPQTIAYNKELFRLFLRGSDLDEVQPDVKLGQYKFPVTKQTKSG